MRLCNTQLTYPNGSVRRRTIMHVREGSVMNRSIGAAVAATLACAACTAATPAVSVAPRNGGPQRVIDAAARTRIDSTLRRFVESGMVAGASALVYEKGDEVYFNAFGMADREAHQPMARDAIVQIFSMTKPITGVALMTLYEQGKFQLDDPVSKYAPELANVRVYAGADASGAPMLVQPRRPMTIRDLTRHTAGFATGEGDPGVGPRLKAPDP